MLRKGCECFPFVRVDMHTGFKVRQVQIGTYPLIAMDEGNQSLGFEIVMHSHHQQRHCREVYVLDAGAIEQQVMLEVFALSMQSDDVFVSLLHVGLIDLAKETNNANAIFLLNLLDEFRLRRISWKAMATHDG